MKNLLNLGVSDPLTLGMAHPIADRLETLGRARRVSRGGRAAALGLIVAVACASAPFTIAESHPEKEVRKFAVHMDGNLTGKSYEIVTEDGETKAYRLLKGGERSEIDVIEKADGGYSLMFEDGEVIEVPHIDLKGLEGLKSLEGLKGLEGLEGLEGLKGLEGLSALSSLEGLSGLSELSELSELGDLSNVKRFVLKTDDLNEETFSGDIEFKIDGSTFDIKTDGESLSDEDREKLQDFLRDNVKGQFFDRDDIENLVKGEGLRTFRFNSLGGGDLPDTIISSSIGDRFGGSPAFYEDVDAEIEAILADDNIDIRTRKAKARRLKAGALQAEFRRTTPLPTRLQSVQNCVATLDILNRDYRYHKQKRSDESHQDKCERLNPTVRWNADGRPR